MKFISIFILIALTLSTSFSTRIRKHRGRSLRSLTKQDCLAPTNKWLAFFKNLVIRALAISNDDLKTMCTCVKGLGLEKADNAAEAVDAKADEPKSTLQKVLDVIQAAINFICKFKDQIVKMITGRRFRRSMKLFLENQKGFWDSLVSVATSVGNGFKAIGDWASKKWDQLTSWAKDLVGTWKGHFEHFTAKVKAIFKKFMEIYNTLKACYSTIKTGIAKVKDFIAKVTERSAEIGRLVAGDPTAIANFFVNLICQFAIFREAITALVNAMAEADVLKKYALYGTFGGAAIRILLGLTSF